MRSWVCVRQFRDEKHREDLLAGTPDTIFIKVLLEKAASNKNYGVALIAFSFASMHSKEGIILKPPEDVNSPQNWKLKSIRQRNPHPKMAILFSAARFGEMIFPIILLNPCELRTQSDGTAWCGGDDMLVLGRHGEQFRELT